MVQTKCSCHFITRKLIDHGYRPKVQIVIKYLILGDFQIFKLECKLILVV